MGNQVVDTNNNDESEPRPEVVATEEKHQSNEAKKSSEDASTKTSTSELDQASEQQTTVPPETAALKGISENNKATKPTPSEAGQSEEQKSLLAHETQGSVQNSTEQLSPPTKELQNPNISLPPNTTTLTKAPENPNIVVGGGTISVTDNDVLLGRGDIANHHAGNKMFRSLARSLQQEYVVAAKLKKAEIALRVVDQIHQKGGRFLAEERKGHWTEVSKEKAHEKAKQAMREKNTKKAREKTSQVMREINKEKAREKTSEATREKSSPKETTKRASSEADQTAKKSLPQTEEVQGLIQNSSTPQNTTALTGGSGNSLIAMHPSLQGYQASGLLHVPQQQPVVVPIPPSNVAPYTAVTRQQNVITTAYQDSQRSVAFQTQYPSTSTIQAGPYLYTAPPPAAPPQIERATFAVPVPPGVGRPQAPQLIPKSKEQIDKVCAAPPAAAPPQIERATCDDLPEPPGGGRPQAPQLTPKSKEQRDKEMKELELPNAKKQPFAYDDSFFIGFAKIYIEKELYKARVRGAPQRWQEGKKEFGDSFYLFPDKSMAAFKKLFLESLELRTSCLGTSDQPESEDTEAETICRQIQKLKLEYEESKKGTAEAKKSDEQEKEEKKKTKIGKIDNDFEMSPELYELLQAADKDREEKKYATYHLEKAEKELEEAKKRMAEALEKKKSCDTKAETSMSAFTDKVVEAPGKWPEMYKELRTYYAESQMWIMRGQDPKRKELREWVLRQRKRYAMNDRCSNKLPWYLVRALNDINFPWNLSGDAWHKTYAMLVEFQKEKGHCRVPRKYPPNPLLANFVKRMRVERKTFDKDPKKTNITAEQFKLLDDIGFTWENLHRNWNEQFENFKKFVKENGHGNVPKDCPKYPKLPQWCQNQRAHHNCYLSGKKTYMNMEREKQLNDAGFVWGTPGNPRSPKRKRQKVVQENPTVENDVSGSEEGQEVYQHDPHLQDQINAALMATMPPSV